MSGKRKHPLPKIGDEFNNWEVIGKPFAQKKRIFNKQRMMTTWRCLCRCQCGAQQTVDIGNLRTGGSTQCHSCARELRTLVGKQYKAWGESKNITHWLQDPRCKIGSYHKLYTRLRLLPVEEAIGGKKEKE